MKYRLGVYEKAMPDTLSWEERLCAVRDAGFDFCEISIDETGARLDRLKQPYSFRRELRDLGRSIGVSIDTMCLSGHRRFPMGSSDPETEKRSMEIMEDAVHFAADVGIKIIQLAGYDVYYDEPSTPFTRERFIENLRVAAALAADNGIMLGIETMENAFCNTVCKALGIINEVGSPWLQIYPDVGNVFNGTHNPQGDLRDGKGRVVAAHLKETSPGVFRNLFYGEGRVDMAASVHTLYQMGVRRFNAEFWYDGGVDWEGRLRTANHYLRKFLEKEAANLL